MANRKRKLDLGDNSSTGGGGIQQHLKQDEVVLESLVAKFLLELFAWGFISSILVQQLAYFIAQDIKLAQETGGVFKDLEKLAKAGNSGKAAQNVHRDIMTNTCVPQLPAFRLHIPFKDGLDHLTHMLLPHETFAAMYNNYRAAFDKFVLGPKGRLETFWQQVQHHPALDGHPVKNIKGWKSCMVPLGMHGDEVPVVGVGKVWSKCFLTFQWFSLLAVGTGYATKDVLIWIWGVFDKMIKTGASGTIMYFMMVLRWSLKTLMSRKWPTHDWRNVRHLALV